MATKAEAVSSSTLSRPTFRWTTSTSRTTLTVRSSRVHPDHSAIVPSMFSATLLTPTPTRQLAILLTPFTSITTSLPLVRAQELPPTMVLLLQQLTTPFPAHQVGLDLVSVIRRLVLIATLSVQSLVSTDSGSTANLKSRSRTTRFKTLRRNQFKLENTTTETPVATTRVHHQTVHTLQTTSSPTTLEHATPFGCTVAILTVLPSTSSPPLQPS